MAYKLLRMRHRTWPYKLFVLLSDDGIAGEAIRTEACMLDPFTKEFISGQGHLTTAQLLAKKPVLRAVAELAHVETVSTERAHATTLRRAKTRLHTHPAKVPELAAWMAMRSCARVSLQAACAASKPCAKRKRMSAVENVQVPKKKRRVSGWNAFRSVHESSVAVRDGQRFARVAELAERWKSLTPEEKLEYSQMGSLMRPGDKQQRCRDRQKQRRQRRLAAMLQPSAACPPLQAVVEVENREARLARKEAPAKIETHLLP
eukprot:6492113-Amphidinium_carterae.1